jgi:hypothetical protein
MLYFFVLWWFSSQFDLVVNLGLKFPIHWSLFLKFPMYKSFHIDILTPTRLIVTLIWKSIIHVHKKQNLYNTFNYIFNAIFNFWNHVKVQTWLGYHIWTLRIHSKDFQIHLFFHFSYDMSYILPFSLMSNEIILFQILYKHLKYLFFSLIKVKIVKFIQCGPCFINGPKLS